MRLIRSLLLTLSFLALTQVAFVAQSAEIADINRELLENVEIAQLELSRLEAQISEERQSLAEQLNQAQNSVSRLRDQSAAARRLADEQTLSLTQLEDRLKTWQDQSLYQSRLLASFNDQTRQSRDQISLGAVDELKSGLDWLETYLVRQQQYLLPQWQEQELVLTDGKITNTQRLQLGPVQWFWQENERQGGLVNTDQELAKVALLFTDDAQTNLGNLYSSQQGEVMFDPTLSRALLLAVEDESIMQHLEKGGVWVLPILLFALFASSIAVMKGVSLWRLPKFMPALPERIEAAIQHNDKASEQVNSILASLDGAQSDLLKISMKFPDQEQRDDHLFACLLDHKHQLERWLGAIAVTAAVAPLLGLLGTVSGMITTFKLMTLFGAGDPSAVSEGISEALVTTELGLIVAIPALLAHALMSRKVKSYFGQLESNAIKLSQLKIPSKSA